MSSEHPLLLIRVLRIMLLTFALSRYAIDDNSIDWKQAESQASKLGGSGNTVVSLKSTSGGLKRKHDDGGGAADAGKKAKTRRGGGKKVKT